MAALIVPGDPELAEIDGLLPMWFFPVGAVTIGAILLAIWWCQPA